jgi:hypothetical protein
MSIIFQLFRAEDLQRLEKEDLEELRKLVIEALEPHSEGKSFQEIIRNAGKRDPNKLPLIDLNLKKADKLPDNAPKVLKARVNEMLNERGEEVSQQLQRSRNLSRFTIAKLKKQHHNQANRDQDAKEDTILEWAISCEVNNLAFYAPLVRARKAAYDYFLDKTGQRPKEPDSPYSPFNPNHPLHKYFSGFYDAGSY